jgi:transaldolase
VSGVGSGFFYNSLVGAGTEFWVNNPSLSEMEMALSAGAVGVASNPSYINALLKTEPDFVRATAREVLPRSVVPAGADNGRGDDGEDERLAMQVIQKTVSRPLGIFQPKYEETEGRYGHVAIQGNPRRNDDADAMLAEAEKFRDLGENVIIKQPATVAGIQVLEELTARGWPTIGTMSFAVDQYIAVAEAHRRGLRRTTKKPRCLITMLPGMFDEYLAEDAARRGVEVSPRVLSQAGISAARAAYKIYRERRYEAVILAGGARSKSHWTELVGDGMAITLSGALARKLIDENPPVVNRIEASAPDDVIRELRDVFPDFVRACDVDSLASEEFRAYGPVVRFQNSLLGGMGTIIKEIEAARAERSEKQRP